MCGRFVLTEEPSDLQAIYDFLNEIDFPPRFNIAPTQPVLALWEQQGRRTANLVRWGFVPNWVKDPREFSLLVNARAETIGEKPAFRDALRHQRCIVPATGYYEWHTGSDRTKTPHYITRHDGASLALAGLYSNWQGPNGEEVDTLALITVPANEELSAIHHRMPAILDQTQVDDWLNTREVESRAAAAMIAPLATGMLRAHPVSTRVNGARDDDADLIREVTPAKPVKPPADQLDLF